MKLPNSLTAASNRDDAASPSPLWRNHRYLPSLIVFVWASMLCWPILKDLRAALLVILIPAGYIPWLERFGLPSGSHWFLAVLLLILLLSLPWFSILAGSVRATAICTGLALLLAAGHISGCQMCVKQFGSVTGIELDAIQAQRAYVMQPRVRRTLGIGPSHASIPPNPNGVPSKVELLRTCAAAMITRGTDATPLGFRFGDDMSSSRVPGLFQPWAVFRKPVGLDVEMPAPHLARSITDCLCTMLIERRLQILGIPRRMPKQCHHHPVRMNAKIDRIREGLGEDTAELLVNQPVGSGIFLNFRQLSAKRHQELVTKLLAAASVIPFCPFVGIFPDFRQNAQSLHLRLAFINASNCSSVSARDGSRSNRAHRSSSPRFSASLTSIASLASPMDCQISSTMRSFSRTGSAYTWGKSARVMAPLSRQSLSFQPPCFTNAQRASVMQPRLRRTLGNESSRTAISPNPHGVPFRVESPLSVASRSSVLECSSPLELFAGRKTFESAGGPGALQNADAFFHAQSRIMS